MRTPNGSGVSAPLIIPVVLSTAKRHEHHVTGNTTWIPAEDVYKQYTIILCFGNSVSGVMVSVFALSAVDRGFEPTSDQTKYY